VLFFDAPSRSVNFEMSP